MKINQTINFVNDSINVQRNDKEIGGEQKDRGIIFAGNLNLQTNPIEQKKEAARKQAMKIVGDAFEGDRKIDTDIEKRKNKISKLRETMSKANDELKEIASAREELRKVYGIEEGSEEEKQLRLLEKEQDAKKIGSQVTLSKEEEEELARIKAEGISEYQQRSLDMRKSGSVYESEITEAKKQIQEETAIIRGVKLERLKNDPMVKADRQADAVMEAASEEIVNMVVEEAKKHVDEELEEKKEAAEEKEKEEEIQEAKIEKIKEKKRQQEELTEILVESTEYMLALKDVKTEVQEEVQKVLTKMKLLEEDIKGAAVDETL